MPIELRQLYAGLCADIFDRLVELQAESRTDTLGAPVSSVACMDALLSCAIGSVPARAVTLTMAATPDGTLMLRWWDVREQEVHTREYTGKGL